MTRKVKLSGSRRLLMPVMQCRRLASHASQARLGTVESHGVTWHVLKTSQVLYLNDYVHPRTHDVDMAVCDHKTSIGL